jgi:hypothetical protein
LYLNSAIRNPKSAIGSTLNFMTFTTDEHGGREHLMFSGSQLAASQRRAAGKLSPSAAASELLARPACFFPPKCLAGGAFLSPRRLHPCSSVVNYPD